MTVRSSGHGTGWWWTLIALWLAILAAGADVGGDDVKHGGDGGDGSQRQRQQQRQRQRQRTRAPRGHRAFLKGDWKKAEVEMEAAVAQMGRFVWRWCVCTVQCWYARIL